MCHGSPRRDRVRGRFRNQPSEGKHDTAEASIRPGSGVMANCARYDEPDVRGSRRGLCVLQRLAQCRSYRRRLRISSGFGRTNRIRNRKPAFERQNFPRTVRFSQQAFEAEVGDLAESLMVETGILADGVGVGMAQESGDFANGMAAFHQSIRASVT